MQHDTDVNITPTPRLRVPQLPDLKSQPPGIKIAIVGSILCITAIATAVITFINGSTFQLQQQFFAAPPCAAGVLHTSSCIATVKASVIKDSVSQHCDIVPNTNQCTPYLNATFLIPPSTTASTTIDIQFDGNVAWSAGTQAVLQIWNSTITAVQVNGQTLHTTAYPTGTTGEASLYGLAIGFFIFGALIILYGILKLRSP